MGRPRNKVYDEVAYELYLSGLSLDQVGEQLGVTRQCVFKCFKKRGFVLRGKVFKPSIEYNGIKFSMTGRGYYESTKFDGVILSRYVWENEVGPIPDGYEIHHKDRDKTNNDIGNLQCLSKADHTRLHHLENHASGKIGKRVVMMDMNGNKIKDFRDTAEAAQEVKCHRSNITMVINGSSKTAKGYKWKYADEDTGSL